MQKHKHASWRTVNKKEEAQAADAAATSVNVITSETPTE